jgi:hypothetical protein
MKLHVIFSHFIINNTFNSSFNQTPLIAFYSTIISSAVLTKHIFLPNQHS